MSKPILHFLWHFLHSAQQDSSMWAGLRAKNRTTWKSSLPLIAPQDYRVFIFKAKKRLTRMLVLLCHRLDYGTSTADAALK